MLFELEIVFVIFCISPVHMQLRPSCVQFDFNDQDSILQFEPCDSGLGYGFPMFVTQSYKDVYIEPFRSGAEYHLSNNLSSLSCIRTKNTYHLDGYTEIEFAIYLQSNDVDDESFVDIRVVDTVNPVYLGGTTTSNEWNVTHANVNFQYGAGNIADMKVIYSVFEIVLFFIASHF